MPANYRDIETPCYVVDLGALERNLQTLAEVARRADCTILLAQKGFAMFGVYPLCRRYLSGVCASSVDEARLGREEFGGEVHAYAPAYSDAQMAEMVTLADTIVFNSFAQLRRHRQAVEQAPRDIDIGLRVNPRYAEVEVDIYNPCSAGSRLGILREAFEGQSLEGVSGLHFHTMCEQNADVLARTLPHVEEQFGRFFDQLDWINFGGGHHITRADYDVDQLVQIIQQFQSRWGLKVYLEPGEAIALNTGVLVSTVLDVVRNELDIAILDASAACHMPDVLEMPYRPNILGAGAPGEKAHTYRLGGLSCLAGDVIGDYSFDEPLRPGDTIVLLDMAHYTMVKNTTFNGVRLPSIATYNPADEAVQILRRFSYQDFRTRLS